MNVHCCTAVPARQPYGIQSSSSVCAPNYSDVFFTDNPYRGVCSNSLRAGCYCSESAGTCRFERAALSAPVGQVLPLSELCVGWQPPWWHRLALKCSPMCLCFRTECDHYKLLQFLPDFVIQGFLEMWFLRGYWKMQTSVKHSQPLYPVLYPRTDLS